MRSLTLLLLFTLLLSLPVCLEYVVWMRHTYNIIRRQHEYRILHNNWFSTTSTVNLSSNPTAEGRVLFPEELVSFLSFVYSILPPVKVGQDSRIGAGFRVGPNADFQVLLELGPQSETKMIGPNTNSVRDTRENVDSKLKNAKKSHGKKWKDAGKDKTQKSIYTKSLQTLEEK